MCRIFRMNDVYSMRRMSHDRAIFVDLELEPLVLKKTTQLTLEMLMIYDKVGI